MPVLDTGMSEYAAFSTIEQQALPTVAEVRT